MIFCLKCNYSNHNRKQAHVDDIPQNGCYISFEEVSNRLKTYSKSITDVKNTTLKKIKAFFRRWLETAFIVYIRDRVRGKKLPNRFEGWIQRECRIKMESFFA